MCLSQLSGPYLSKIPGSAPGMIINHDHFLVCTDEANTIHLKCNIATGNDSCSALDHHVPVFICSKDALQSSEWDITTQQVSNFDIGMYDTAPPLRQPYMGAAAGTLCHRDKCSQKNSC